MAPVAGANGGDGVADGGVGPVMVTNTDANGGGGDEEMMDGGDMAEWLLYGDDGVLIEPPRDASNTPWGMYALEYFRQSPGLLSRWGLDDWKAHMREPWPNTPE